MSTRLVIPMLSATLITAGLATSFAPVLGAPQATVRPGSTEEQSADLPSEAPSSAEINIRSQKLIANQHRDDEVLQQYERIERHRNFTAGPNPHAIEDKTYRVVPTGTGSLKILLKDNGTPTDPAEYRRQLQAWEDVLELMLKPNDSRAKTAYEKYNKRQRERSELVDAMITAFATRWLRQETVNGYSCDVFELTPKPNFHPKSMFEDALTHVTAKTWVDHDSNQLVRGEAHIMRDISFGGGILGKLYRGGVFSMEQSEVEAGIWEPTRYQYDFEGRKFLFTFEEHQIIEANHYRRVGPPREALIVVQNELASGKAPTNDP
ncbi:MAG: hypothetical protein ACRD4Q_06660 [Candidatus Acidiferrales bacterium]